MGKPAVVPTAADAYFVKRASGAIEGPTPSEGVVGAILAGALGGDETVSKDRKFWIPIMAIPEFGAAFRDATGRGGTVVGAQAPMAPVAPGTPEEQALNTADFSVVRDIAEQARRAAQFGELPRAGGTLSPIGATGLGSVSERASRLATGSWSSNPDDPAAPAMSEASVASIQTNADALGAVSGLRRVSPEGMQPGTGMTGQLPLPKGFTNYPVAFNPESIPGLGGVTDLPRPAGGRAELPRPAGGRSELPTSAQRPELPRSMGGTELPRSLGGTELPAGLPDSYAPASMTGGGVDPYDRRAPASQGASGVPATAAFNVTGSGYDEENLPASRGAPVGSPRTLEANFGDFGEPMSGGIGEGSPEDNLPASSRAVGTQMLEQLGEAENLWVGQSRPSIGLSAGDGSGAIHGFGGRSVPPRTTGISTAAAEEAPQDPFATPGPAGGWGTRNEELPDLGQPPPSDFADFFPPADATPAAGSATKARRKLPTRALVAGMVAVFVGAGAFGAYHVWQTRKAEEEQRVRDEEARRRAELERASMVKLGEISELQTGSSKTLSTFVDNGRRLLRGGGTDLDRAKTVIAATMLLAEQPGQKGLYSEITRWNSGIRSREEAISKLAAGAALAASGDAGAAEALKAVDDPALRSFAALFEGIAGLQAYRGIDYSEPVAPSRAAPKEGSGAAAEGSGAAKDGSGKAGEGSGAAAAKAPSAEGSGEAKAAAPAAAAPVQPEAELQRTLPDSVAAAFNRATQLDPKFVSPRFWLGWIALDQRRLPEAEQEFTKALELNPQHVRSLVGLAETLLKEGQLIEAETRITRAIEDLADVMTQAERSQTYLVAADIAIARIQPELAIENLLSSLQADPQNKIALNELGEQFYRAGQFQRAIEYFQQNAGLAKNDPESTLGLIKAKFGLAAWEDLRKLLEPAITKFSRDGRFAYWLGRVHEEAAEFSEARQLYDQAVQTDPNYLRPYIRLAQLSYRANDPSGARKRLDDALAVETRTASVANEIGEVFLLIGETNRAVTSFRRSLAIDRSYPDARLNLADFFMNTNQFQRGLDEIEEMMASGVDSPKVKYMHARALIGIGKVDQAIEGLLKLLESDPKNADYRFMMGRAHFETRAFAPARENFAAAYATEPSMDKALYYVGRCDLELGHFNEAISALTRVSQRDPSGEFHYWLGYALERAEQLTQSMQEYTATIEKDIGWSLENPEVFYRRGRLMALRGQGAAAQRDLKVVLTLQPNHAQAAWTLGKVAFDRRDFDEAIVRMSHSLSIDPKQPETNYFVGLSYLGYNPPRNAEALPYFQKAREGGLEATRPEVLQKLAYTLRDLGRRAEAASALKEFVDRAELPADERREMENEIQNLGGRR
jgi:tetratricopeptide (TPR) repeat protein